MFSSDWDVGAVRAHAQEAHQNLVASTSASTSKGTKAAKGGDDDRLLFVSLVSKHEAELRRLAATCFNDPGTLVVLDGSQQNC
jgi:hypothetical protein